jgi:hypothetical protein
VDSQYHTYKMPISADQIEHIPLRSFRDKDLYWYILIKVTNKNRKYTLMNTQLLLDEAFYGKTRNHPIMAIYKVLRNNSPLIKKHKKMSEDQIIRYLEDDLKFKFADSNPKGRLTKRLSLDESNLKHYWTKNQRLLIGDIKPKSSKYVLFKTRGFDGDYLKIQGDTKE